MIYLDVITSFAFIVESVYSVDTGTFVISTKKEKIFWVSEVSYELLFLLYSSDLLNLIC